jgi:hypothetical protein
MAQVQCPRCKATLDEQELLCPRCGASLLPELSRDEMNRLKEPTAMSKAMGTLVRWVIFAVVLLVFVVTPLMYVGMEVLAVDRVLLIGLVLALVPLLAGGIGLAVFRSYKRARRSERQRGV